MKRIISIIALLAVFTANAQAQFVDPTPNQPSRQNTYSSSDLYAKGQRNIKTGNIIFFTGVGAWTTLGIILAIVEGDGTALWETSLLGIATGGVIASPFWITGLVRKNKAKNMAYMPVLQQDIPINDNLTFTPSIGITNYHGLSPTTNSLQSNALSVGFSLNF